MLQITQWKTLLRGVNWTHRTIQSRCDHSVYKIVHLSFPECRLRSPSLATSISRPHPESTSQAFFSRDTTGALHTAFSFQYQQMRWKGRNDGNSYFAQPRKPTKKQRKKYHRLLQKQQVEREKHGKPGSKAGLRRQWEQREKQEFLESGRNATSNSLELAAKEEDTSYGWDDALLDDVIGNVNKATPTPQPAYLGHKHRFYYNAVVDQMDDYFQSLNQHANGATVESTALTTTDSSRASSTAVAAAAADLPTDEMISKALRAFRDKNGTRYKNPVGIIPALQHVLYDMQVPLHALGEYTFSTLLTCCRSPSEGRRVLQLIREQGQDVSSYCWTILCDLYAKAADVKGCVQVQQEMLHHGVSPTLPSYTSLIAACYRVSINGRVPHSVRAEASKIGWEKWQEMRIIGIEADAMAYGAILRLKAATGKAEDCINVLQEMERFSVNPTTLCFASALRGVARSHAIAIRYERGSSPRHRRREAITLHHGKLTRKIVIMAESAGIEPDDGYISALCLCAGAAGDLATAKAIYIASEILRTQKDLRRIGSDAHLARLRGESGADEVADEFRMFENPGTMNGRVPGLWDEDSTNALVDDSMSGNSILQASNFIANGEDWSAPPASEVTTQRKKYIPSFGEREYGKDNRVLSSILHACAHAVDPAGMGTIWQGRENNGYLCLNSLRLIAQPKLPEYSDNSIPGQTMTDNLRLKNEHRQDYREGKRESRKFAGIEIDENAGSTLDDIGGDTEYAKRFVTPDGRRRPEYRKTTPEELWRLKYGDDWDKELRAEDPKSSKTTTSTARDMKSIESSNATDLRLETGTTSVDTLNSMEARAVKTSKVPSPDMYFDYDSMRWKPKSEQSLSTSSTAVMPQAGPVDDNVKKDSGAAPSAEEEEMYFDSDTMRWKTRPRATKKESGKVMSSSTDSAEEEGELDLDSAGLYMDGDNKDESDADDEEQSPTDWKMEDFEDLKKSLQASDRKDDDFNENDEVDLSSDWEVDDEDEDQDELSSDWEVEDLDVEKLDDAISSASAKSGAPDADSTQKYRFDKDEEKWIPISKGETETGGDMTSGHSKPPTILTEFESKVATGELKSPALDPSLLAKKSSMKKVTEQTASGNLDVNSKEKVRVSCGIAFEYAVHIARYQCSKLPLLSSGSAHGNIKCSSIS
jgi:Pentatricopeptide repeat domain